MKDITTRQDIIHLIDSFYTKVVKDDLIGSYFTEVVTLDFEKHLPVMYNFWESVLLGGTSYKGNPMIKHIQLHQKKALEEKHFNRWLTLWEQTIDEHFTGSVADQAKHRAKSIKGIMMFKLKTI